MSWKEEYDRTPTEFRSAHRDGSISTELFLHLMDRYDAATAIAEVTMPHTRPHGLPFRAAIFKQAEAVMETLCARGWEPSTKRARGMQAPALAVAYRAGPKTEE